MATRFEIVAFGANSVSTRAATEEALDEIERLDRKLSLYNPSSEIAQLNGRAAHSPVRLSPEVFELLLQTARLSKATGGAFDISIAPVIRCWGFMRGQGQMPAESDIALAMEKCGMDQIEFDDTNFEVRFTREGVMVDLGAVGKGYALDQAGRILREGGVEHALLHGGTSSVIGIGHNAGEGKWKVAIDGPPPEKAGETSPPLAVVELENESLSVSAVWGKQFENEGRKFGHLIDPRTGWPAEANMLAAVVLPSAMESDAFSTALLIGGADAIGPTLQEARWMLVGQDLHTSVSGISLC